MSLFYAAIERDSVSFLRFLFLSHVQVFLYVISALCRLKKPKRSFFSFPFFFFFFFLLLLLLLLLLVVVVVVVFITLIENPVDLLVLFLSLLLLQNQLLLVQSASSSIFHVKNRIFLVDICSFSSLLMLNIFLLQEV